MPTSIRPLQKMCSFALIPVVARIVAEYARDSDVSFVCALLGKAKYYELQLSSLCKLTPTPCTLTQPLHMKIKCIFQMRRMWEGKGDEWRRIWDVEAHEYDGWQQNEETAGVQLSLHEDDKRLGMLTFQSPNNVNVMLRDLLTLIQPGEFARRYPAWDTCAIFAEFLDIMRTRLQSDIEGT